MAEITDLTQQYKMPFVWPRLPLDVNRVDAVVIHHTVTFFLSPNATVAEEKAHIQMIHLYHKSIGFVGFAYHYIVFPSGRSYLVVSLKQFGTHVEKNNGHLGSVAAAGNFISVLPGDFQRDGVTDCIAAWYAYTGRRLPVRPHKAYTPTSCPGRWEEILNELIPEEDDMTPEEIEKAVIKAITENREIAQAVREWCRRGAVDATRDILAAVNAIEGGTAPRTVKFPGATIKVPPVDMPVE